MRLLANRPQIIWFAFVTAGMLLAPMVVYAEPSLTLQAVLQATKLHFPKLIQAQQEILRQQAEIRFANGYFDPTISSSIKSLPSATLASNTYAMQLLVPTRINGIQVFSEYKRGIGDYPVYEGSNQTLSRGQWQMGINMPLLREHNIDEPRAALQRSQLSLRMAKQDYDNCLLETYLQAAQAYWYWLAAGYKVKISEKLEQLAIKRQDIIVKRFKHGDVSKADVIENKSMILLRHNELLDSQLIFKKAANQLAVYYRDHNGNTRVPTQEYLPQEIAIETEKAFDHNLPGLTSIAKQLRFHPALLALDNTMKKAKLEVSLAKNQMLPQLDAKVFADKDQGDGFVSQSHSVNLGLNFSMPIYRRQSEARLRQAQLQKLKILMDRNLLYDRLVIASQNARLTVIATRKQYQNVKQTLSIYQQLQENEQQRYLKGDSDLF